MTGPAYRQRHFTADIVQIALCPWHARYSMVATDDQQGVMQLASRFEFFNQNPKPNIGCLTFAQIVGYILAHVVNVGQECW
jgi:hypothetical protein